MGIHHTWLSRKHLDKSPATKDEGQMILKMTCWLLGLVESIDHNSRPNA